MINQESSNFFRQLRRNCLRKLRILAKFPSPSAPAILSAVRIFLRQFLRNCLQSHSITNTNPGLILYQKKHSYPIWAVFWYLHALYSPHSLSKSLCWALSCSIPCQKGLVTPYEFICASHMPFTGPILHQKNFATPSELFSANFWHFPACVLHHKSFLTPYELFPASHMSLIHFAPTKALLSHMSSFFAYYIPFTGLFLHH